jgi:GTPase SAR1 family protein
MRVADSPAVLPLQRSGQPATPSARLSGSAARPSSAAPTDAVRHVLTAINEGRSLAAARERPDLVERLDRAGERLAARVSTVAVVGEFKRGKSTLVNALIQKAVCPVDADIVTAVPTLVRYGEQAAVYVQRQADEGSGPTQEAVSFAELRSIVSETSDDTPSGVRSVEILRAGLRLLDTPGVGGLESAHGQVTLATLDGVDGALFVTDASQELTAPELAFLKLTLDRCHTVALVLTKTDLHRHWRRIVDLDRAHLARAGVDVPVIALSSFLRMRATHRPALNEESGFGPLVEYLARDVVQPAAARAAAAAAAEVEFVADQLAKQSDAERVVLARPERSNEVVERLSEASGRAHALTMPTATWQQMLNDGIQDLVADVDHDLQARLRRVLKDVRDLIDHSDPRDTWLDTGAWLRRESAAAGVANRDLLVARANELIDAVAVQFNLESGHAVDVQFDLMSHSLEELDLPSASTFTMPGGRLGSLLVTARTTTLVPMVAVSLISSPFMIAGAAILAAGLGAKLFRDEGRRRREYRQQQAKVAAAKFVDEAGFQMNKATRDSLRRTQRLLRDEFHSRAQAIQASANGALVAAHRARALDVPAQERRSSQLDADSARLGVIRADMHHVSRAGAHG